MPRSFQRLQDLTDLVIQIADIGEIRAARAFDIVFRNIKAPPVIGVEYPLRMWVMIVIIKSGHLWQQVFAILIQVPVLLSRHIRIMRMREANRQAPRALILAARQIINLARRVIGNLIIIFHLIGDFGHTRAGDRPHIVIPPINPLTGFAIIRRPAKIGGINIRRQTLLEPMHLVRTDEMHLAGQAGLIPRPPQMMRISWDVRGKLCRVVIDPRAAGKLPGHKARPPRRT